MNNHIAAVARAAAERLTSEYGPQLAVDVEVALHARGPERDADQYADPVALASLIVSIATLAWTIYTDLRNKTPAPAPEVIARALRVEVGRYGDGTSDSDKITDVVVSEIIYGVGDGH
jgi:hypothetical protein